MPPVTPRRRRARPVADAPIDLLLPRSEDLAKGWLLALLEQARLDEAPGILTGELTREGPRLCDAVLRAVADDADLRRLEPGGALSQLASSVGELAGASAPAAVSRAVDALHAVIWTAIRDELRAPDPDLISELSERLTMVSELLRGAALAQGTAAGPGGHAAAPAPRAAPPRSRTASGPPAAEAPRDALWIGALEEEIDGCAAAPLALLLAELDDADRVAVVESEREADATFGRFADSVRGAVRRHDIVVFESAGRAWIIARDTSRDHAHELGERIGERIANAVRESQWQGAPLVVSVGIAVLGEDGVTTAELIGAAEEARFAAVANGVAVGRARR